MVPCIACGVWIPESAGSTHDDSVTSATGRVAAESDQFAWLDQPSSMGAITVTDALAAQDATEYQCMGRGNPGSMVDPSHSNQPLDKFLAALLLNLYDTRKP